MKLTQEQSDFVTDNHQLIYWYCNLKRLDIEEFYDILAIELCRCAIKYDKDKGSFSNYFKIRADRIVIKEYEKNNTKKRFHENMIYIDDYHQDFVDAHKPDENKEVQLWIDSDETKILKLKSEGYNQREISEMLGYNQTFISRTLKRLKKEYKECL